MRKILIIGELPMDIVIDTTNGVEAPVGMRLGGRLPNAATLLAKQGLSVAFAGEASTDSVGDRVVAWLDQAGVNTASIDRTPEGITPSQLLFNGNGASQVVRYEQAPPEGFDIVWPRFEAGDVVIFGGYYALDPLRRQRLLQLLQHCQERQGIMVYVPGFLPQRMGAVTRIMPALLENLELADVVVTRTSDIQNLFGTADDAHCHTRYISYYAPLYFNIDPAQGVARIYADHATDQHAIEALSHTMHWNAGFIAGLAAAMAAYPAGKPDFYAFDAQQASALLSAGCDAASHAIDGLPAWQLLN